MAALIPAIPPPTTSAAWITGLCVISSGASRLAFSTPIQTMSMALRVAASFSALCTQESWFRTFTISSRNGFRPARIRTFRKMPSWVLGEQAATTTRLIPFEWIASSISRWVLPAQENIWFWAQTTSGSLLANSTTRGTSTTPAMFEPQWQTKTPTRGVSIPSRGSTYGASGKCRPERWQRASEAAAPASATLSGMSLGPLAHPAA